MDNDNTSRSVSFVIPVYRSEPVLRELVARIDKVAQENTSIIGKYEIIFVCDASPDESWVVICELASKYNFVNGILLRMNAGQHNAIMAGLQRAQGNIIITMDDDLQHDPLHIVNLIKKLNEGYDVVYANFINRHHAYWKVLGSKFNNLIAGYLIGKPKDIYLSPFKAIRSYIVQDLKKYTGPYVYIDGLILMATRNIGTISVPHAERYAGDGGYDLKRSLALWLKMATSFSIIPLRITSFMGLFFAGTGFLLAILLVVQKFTLNMMPIGWSSLIVTILIIGGVQLLALGVIGEYLGRVLLTMNSRPQFILDKTVGFNNKTSNS